MSKNNSNIKKKKLKPSQKGCSSFVFYDETRELDISLLDQASDNPSVYTKLSCYLPWVAAQYDMDYRPAGGPDSACRDGQGDITEVTAKVCRTTSDGWADERDGIEAPCLFPFTLNGESHSGCIMDEIEDFTRPVFRCPIRTVKGAGPNGTDYTDSHLTGGEDLEGYFCPTNR